MASLVGTRASAASLSARASASRVRGVRGVVLPLLRHLSLEHDINLAAAASEFAGASLSAGTRQVYAGALARLDAALDGAPLEDVYLAAYLAMLFTAGKSPATLAQVVAAVRLRAKLAGAPSPTGPATDRMLAGARRQGEGEGAARSRAFAGNRPMRPPRSRPGMAAGVIAARTTSRSPAAPPTLHQAACSIQAETRAPRRRLDATRLTPVQNVEADTLE